MLADITGYSSYLADVELEHSTDILADLLGVVVAQTAGQFELAKLEGDAVFVFAPDGVEGEAVFATVEACYFAFASRTRTIELASSCPCRACRGVGALDLKLVVHHGEFARHDVAGHAELVGSEVVIAHRLLKNSVTQRMGLRAYALFTESALGALGLDPGAIGMTPHRECYPDVGQINAFVLDLAARWHANQERHPVFVTPEESRLTFGVETGLPPAVIWEYMTTPTKLAQWLATDRAEPDNPHGVQGVGSKVHCVKGSVVWENEVLDWKPYRYFSSRAVDRVLGEFIFTEEITAVENGRWRIEFRMRPVGNMRQRVLLALFGSKQRRELQAATARFQALVDTLD